MDWTLWTMSRGWNDRPGWEKYALPDGGSHLSHDMNHRPTLGVSVVALLLLQHNCLRRKCPVRDTVGPFILRWCEWDGEEGRALTTMRDRDKFPRSLVRWRADSTSFTKVCSPFTHDALYLVHFLSLISNLVLCGVTSQTNHPRVGLEAKRVPCFQAEQMPNELSHLPKQTKLRGENTPGFV